MMAGCDRVMMFAGLTCLDVVCFIKQYMREDQGHLCTDQVWQRGGNASNSSTVISLFGSPCELFGTMAVAPETTFLEENLAKYGIGYPNMVYHENCQCPTSVCIVNNHNGSRTILHTNKNLPELTEDDFSKIDLNSGRYKWIHFEGRPTASQIKGMLQKIDDFNKSVEKPEDRITTSVELEKIREQLVLLQDMADYVFISKDHAMFRGFQTAEEAVDGFHRLCRPGAAVICAWGEKGACGKGPDGKLVQVAAYPQEKVVDTLGAGDTFNASTILALSRGYSLQEALDFGCFVAGAKCGMMGFDGIKELKHNILDNLPL
ncbi:ketohexokinase-like isoform X2 [Lineus longissimus]|uniref:ketohexokinase-like isoform X2 n=1 Tax=Lineus longissimus TaxID=88925 RepID=UPI002B4CE924